MAPEAEPLLAALEGFVLARGWEWTPNMLFDGTKLSTDMMNGLGVGGRRRIYGAFGYNRGQGLHVWHTDNYANYWDTTWVDHGDFTDPLILLAKLYETIGGNDDGVH